ADPQFSHLAYTSISYFFFQAHGHHRHLHSFPTLRSSDLDYMTPGFAVCPHTAPASLRRRLQTLRLLLRLPGAEARAQVEALLERSEEHTSELQSLTNLVCRLLLAKKKTEHRSYMSRQSQL